MHAEAFDQYATIMNFDKLPGLDVTLRIYT